MYRRVLREEQSMAGTQLDRIEARLDSLDIGSGCASSRMAKQAGFAGMHHDMLLLHEHVVNQIKALAPMGPSHAEVDRKIGELRENIEQRLDPLEAAVRRLSQT